MGQKYRLLAFPSPVSTRSIESAAPAGLSISEALGRAAESDGWAIEIDGVPVPRDRWEIERPGAGALVTVRAIPQKKIFAIVLPILIIAAAVILGPQIAAGLGFAAGTAAFSTASALATAAIGLIGTLITSALIPPPKQPKIRNEPFVQLQSITGTSNQVNPYGPIPRLYGTMRYFPPVPTTATPYTELVGDDQYLRMFLCLGYGPKLLIGGLTAGAGDIITQDSVGLDPDAIKIGDTNLLEFEEVEFEIGQPSDITLYTNQIEEATLSITLDASDTDPWDPGDKHGDVDLVDSATATQTTAVDTEEISLDVAFVQGLYGVSYKGETTRAEVTFKIEYAVHGSGVWTVLDDAWVIKSQKRETLRTGRRWTVAKGQYDVRLTRTHTFVATQNAGSIEATWTALRSIHHHRAFTVANTVCMALRIKATDQLNQVIQTLSVKAQAILPVWDGSAWVDTPTNSAAWAYADIWTGPANPRPRAKADLDSDALLEWAEWLETNGFEYNKVIDSQSSVFEQAQEPAAAGLAAWGMIDGKITVVRDVPDDVPKALITPRNIAAGSLNWSIRYTDLPHALRVRYLDPDLNQQTERLVYRDGYSGDGAGGTQVATKFETLDAVGCTDADQAWKMGRYHFAQALLRPETYEVEQDYEHLTYQRGDLVHFTHDVVSIGLGAARVVSVNSGTGEITLDDDVTMEAGKSYAIRARYLDSDGTLQVAFRSLVTEPGVGRTITPTAPISGLPVGALIAWGEAESLTIPLKVTRVIPDVDLAARITMVPAALDIYDAWSGTIPAFEPDVSRVDTGAAAPGVPTLVNIRSDATVQPVGSVGQAMVRMVVAYRLAPGTPADHVEVRYRPTDAAQTWKTITAPSGAAFVSIEGVERGVEYDVQIRARRNTPQGPKYSRWSGTATHTVALVTSKVDVQNVKAQAVLRTAALA